MVRAIGSSSYQELRTKDRKIRKKVLPYFYFLVSIHTVYIIIKSNFRFRSGYFLNHFTFDMRQLKTISTVVQYIEKDGNSFSISRVH